MTSGQLPAAMAAVLGLAFELPLTQSAFCPGVCVLQHHLSALEQMLSDQQKWTA